MDWGLKAQALLGLAVFLGIAWLISENRGRFPLKTALTALGLQFVLGLAMLKLPFIQAFFKWLNGGVLALEKATQEGTSFVFGYIGGGGTPFEVTDPANNFVFAFQALPLILIIGALTALLTYWKILPLIIDGFSLLLRKTMGIGGAVGLAAGANIFVGMVESPMFIRDYLDRLSRTELFIVMTLGLSTIAGTVLIFFVSILGTVLPNALGHLLIASVISLPAAIAIATIMVPPDEDAANTDVKIPPKHDYSGSMDALVQGTMAGGRVLFGVVVLLLVFVALVSIVNSILAGFPDVAGAPLTVERGLGWLMAPICWLMGIPWQDAVKAGELMGIKTVLNELLAFIQLAGLEEGAMSKRSIIVLSYGLCGFSNFGALGILIGGLTTMAPGRREEIAELGIRAMIGGTLATCCTAATVSLII